MTDQLTAHDPETGLTMRLHLGRVTPEPLATFTAIVPWPRFGVVLHDSIEVLGVMHQGVDPGDECPCAWHPPSVRIRG